MEKEITELISVLSDELIRHRDVVKIAELLNNTIKEKNIEKVQKLTGQYDEFIGQIETLEEKRILICDAILKTIAPDKHHLNLKSIIALLPDDKQKSLLTIRNSLKNELKKLTHTNTANQILLSESLDVIDQNFVIFTHAENRKNNYQQSGSLKKSNITHKNIVNQIA